MKILIAIHGAHSQPEQMQAQRETWLRNLPCDYRYFLGTPARFDPDVEYVDFADGPVWKGPGRTWTLNRKTEAAVTYALAHGYDYVFKCDDDTFVRPDRLLGSGFEKHDYSGTTEAHSARPIGVYRWAQGGAGYWLSRRAMEIVSARGLHLSPAEDICVGQLLANHGIEPHHDARYLSAATSADYSRPDAITFHKVSATQMRRLS